MSALNIFVSPVLGLLMFVTWMALLRAGDDPMERTKEGLSVAIVATLTNIALGFYFTFWPMFFAFVITAGLFYTFAHVTQLKELGYSFSFVAFGLPYCLLSFLIYYIFY